MQNADDVVGFALAHRYPGISHGHKVVKIFFRRIVDINDKNIGTRGHDLIGEFIVKGEDGIDHLLAFFLENTGFLSCLKHGHNFFFELLGIIFPMRYLLPKFF